MEDIPTDSSSGENVNCDEDDKKTDDPALKELWTKQETLRKAQKREEKIRQQLDVNYNYSFFVNIFSNYFSFILGYAQRRNQNTPCDSTTFSYSRY